MSMSIVNQLRQRYLSSHVLMPRIAGIQHTTRFRKLPIIDWVPVTCRPEKKFNSRLKVERLIPSRLFFDCRHGQRRIKLSLAAVIVDQVLNLLV